MPSQAIQAHSKAIWRESSKSGTVVSADLAVLLDDAGDVTPDLGRVPDAVAIDWEGTGEFDVLWTTPLAIIADGSDLLITDTPGTDPIAAIIADDGSGNDEVTTDLTREDSAELLEDAAGNLVVVPDEASRLDLVQTGDDNVTLY